MAHFYGTLSNNEAKPVTRTGSPKTGITAEVMTKHGRIRVDLWLGPVVPGGVCVDRYQITLLEHPTTDTGNRRVLARGTLGKDMWTESQGGDA